MKIAMALQRLLAVATLCVGVVLMFSETGPQNGLENQIWATVGGFAIALLSGGWLWLTNKEEEYFIHEAR